MTIEIPADDRAIHVFALNLNAEAATRFVEKPAPDRPWPLRDALGADYLEADRVELVRIDDLGALGLTGYLKEGWGIEGADLDGSRLAGLRGMAVLLTPGATGGQAQMLEPRAPLRHLGSFKERPARLDATPLRAESARGELGGATDHGPTEAAGRANRYALWMVLGLGAVIVLALFLALA